MTLTGNREFKKMTQVSPHGWKIGEERKIRLGWHSMTEQWGAEYQALPLLMVDSGAMSIQVASVALLAYAIL
jgi:hypothetical protein